MYAYVEEIYKQQNIRNSTKRLCAILCVTYEKSDLKKAMKNQLQNLIEDQPKYLINLLKKSKSWFMEHQVHGKQTQ